MPGDLRERSASGSEVRRGLIVGPLEMWALALWFMGRDPDLDRYTSWLGVVWIGTAAVLISWIVLHRPVSSSSRASSPSEHVFTAVVAAGLGWTAAAAAWDGRTSIFLVCLGVLALGGVLLCRLLRDDR